MDDDIPIKENKREMYYLCENLRSCKLMLAQINQQKNELFYGREGPLGCPTSWTFDLNTNLGVSETGAAYIDLKFIKNNEFNSMYLDPYQ